MIKRFVMCLMVLVLIYGMFAWSNTRKHPARIMEPCFDPAGRWYTRAE